MSGHGDAPNGVRKTAQTTIENWRSIANEHKTNLSLSDFEELGGPSKFYGTDDQASPCHGAWERCGDFVVAAPEVAAKITTTTRPLVVSGLYLNGKLDLDDDEIKQRITFERCVLSNGVCLDLATTSDLRFDECIFLADPDPDRATFQARGATIRRGLKLTSCCIEGPVDLTGITVESSLYMRDLHVVPDGGPKRSSGHQTWAVDVKNGKIGGDLNLVSCELIGGGLSLVSAVIGLQLSLSAARIAASPAGGRAVNAQRCTVGEDALLRREKHLCPSTPEFRGRVWLFGMKVGGGLSVKGAEFLPAPTRTNPSDQSSDEEHGLDLSYADVKQELHLGATFASGSKITLEHCVAGELALGDPKNLESRWKDAKYYVNGLTYQRYSVGEQDDAHAAVNGDGAVVLDWLRNAADQQSTRPWINAAIVAESSGHASTYLTAMKEASHRVATRAEKIFLQPFGYGFHPSRVIIPLFIVAVLVFFQTRHALDLSYGFVPHVDDGMVTTASKCDSSTERCVTPLLYAIDAVLPFDLGQNSEWTPNRDSSAGRWLDNFVVGAGIISWLLAGVFIAAVAGKLKRTS